MGDVPPLLFAVLRDHRHERERLKGTPELIEHAGLRAFCDVCLERCRRERSGTVLCENILNINHDRTRGEGNQTGSEGRSGSPLEKFSMRYSQNSLSTSEISGVRMATMGAPWLTSFRGMLLATIMPFRTR